MEYSEEVKRTIQIAQSLAKEYRNEQFGPPHLLLAVLHNDVGLASWLAAMHQDINFMREWAEIRLESYPKGVNVPESPVADKQAAATLGIAELIAMQLNHDPLDPVCIFAALLKPEAAFTKDQLKTFPATQKEIMDAVVEDGAIADAIKPDTKTGTIPSGGHPKTNALYKFCVDKTSLAEENRLDPIIGRDRELRMMVEVLGRRTKPNVIIVGEPGVGKTALIDGFAQLIIEKKVPKALQNARLFELDSGALVAGASYKGEVEDRFKNIIKEIKQFEKALLFIDEIHLLLDDRSAIGTGVVNMLKPELARGELTLLGATTLAEYRKYMETDQAFNRRFEVIKVAEPDVETAVHMLKHVMSNYETHHELKVGDDALHEAVVMAQRYSKDRHLPDSALDLMDRTMAAIKMMEDTSQKELEEIKSGLEAIIQEDQDDKPRLLSELRWFQRGLKEKLSPLLLNQLEESDEDQDLEIPDVLMGHLQSAIDGYMKLAGAKQDVVSKSDVASIVAYKTGIPIGKIMSKEREKLLSIDETLKKRVLGQDHAIKAISDAILESRSGLLKGNQPIGSFFLLGPTGTGKTELAKALADFLFNDESFLIRFDMSEFKEEHSAALLYGAPPGYVGYEEGGMLVNKIREKPYSVVLFDEIEKAHPSVFDIFLQILDEGKLHDRLGKEGDFSNAIVLFTSNIASEFIAGKFGENEIPTPNQLMERLSGNFRPEFLGRLTEIVPFAPISEENAVQIFDIHLVSLTQPLAKQGVTLHITPDAKRALTLAGFSPKYGARQIKGVIRNQLRRPISRKIVLGEVHKGTVISLTVDKNQELVWDIKDS